MSSQRYSFFNQNTDEATVHYNSGTCFDFNPSDDTVYLVGTEEGVIRRCSKAYSSKFLGSYTVRWCFKWIRGNNMGQAHKMSVYAVVWNPMHPRVFASCSTDWSVKIWDSSCPNPIFSFDLGSSVRQNYRHCPQVYLF
jgi:dynein intermediate chain 1